MLTGKILAHRSFFFFPLQDSSPTCTDTRFVFAHVNVKHGGSENAGGGLSPPVLCSFSCSPSVVTAACSLRGGTETPSELPPCFQGVWEVKGSGGVRDGEGVGVGGTIRTNGAIHSFILITSAN